VWLYLFFFFTFPSFPAHEVLFIPTPAGWRTTRFFSLEICGRCIKEKQLLLCSTKGVEAEKGSTNDSSHCNGRLMLHLALFFPLSRLRSCQMMNTQLFLFCSSLAFSLLPFLHAAQRYRFTCFSCLSCFTTAHYVQLHPPTHTHTHKEKTEFSLPLIIPLFFFFEKTVSHHIQAVRFY
jgi:hypothetical protein